MDYCDEVQRVERFRSFQISQLVNCSFFIR